MNISNWDPKDWQFPNSFFNALSRKNKLRKIFNLPDERAPF